MSVYYYNENKSEAMGLFAKLGRKIVQCNGCCLSRELERASMNFKVCNQPEAVVKHKFHFITL